MKGPRAKLPLARVAYNIGTQNDAKIDRITTTDTANFSVNNEMNALILAAGYGTRLQRDLENDSSGKYEHLKVQKIDKEQV